MHSPDWINSAEVDKYAEVNQSFIFLTLKQQTLLHKKQAQAYVLHSA
jgi:hypothetical protein